MWGNPCIIYMYVCIYIFPVREEKQEIWKKVNDNPKVNILNLIIWPQILSHCKCLCLIRPVPCVSNPFKMTAYLSDMCFLVVPVLFIDRNKHLQLLMLQVSVAVKKGNLCCQAHVSPIKLKAKLKFLTINMFWWCFMDRKSSF